MLKEQWIKKFLPEKDLVSVDAVKILMDMAYEEGHKKGRDKGYREAAERNREDKYGPMFY